MKFLNVAVFKPEIHVEMSKKDKKRIGWELTGYGNTGMSAYTVPDKHEHTQKNIEDFAVYERWLLQIFTSIGWDKIEGWDVCWQE